MRSFSIGISICLILILLVLPFAGKTQVKVEEKYRTDTVKANALINEFGLKYRNQEDTTIHAFGILFEAYSLSKELNYTKGMIKSSYLLGEYFTTRSNPAKSIEYYYISLQLAEQERDNQSISYGLQGIGLVYFTQKE